MRPESVHNSGVMLTLIFFVTIVPQFHTEGIRSHVRARSSFVFQPQQIGTQTTSRTHLRRVAVKNASRVRIPSLEEVHPWPDWLEKNHPASVEIRWMLQASPASPPDAAHGCARRHTRPLARCFQYFDWRR